MVLRPLSVHSPVTGAAGFWVNVPLLSSTVDAVIYLLYRNRACLGQQSQAPCITLATALQFRPRIRPAKTPAS